MKDNFSTQADVYARYRPSYPPELITSLAALAPGRLKAWDCATGNGQVAKMLVDYFEQVFATDISAKQLEHAYQHPRIQYAQERAETCSAPDHTFDLIVVAQAVHWFKFDAFYAEVKRVLRPKGILALIGYSLFQSGNAEVDALIRHFYESIVGPYWDQERRYIEAGYRTIPFPFEEISMVEFNMHYQWTADDVLGYLNSWSAVQHYLREKHQNPVSLIEKELKQAWGTQPLRKIKTQLLLRVGRV